MNIKSYYSPYSFLRTVSEESNSKIFSQSLEGCSQLMDEANGTVLFYKFLDWDTNYFGIKTGKILFIAGVHEKKWKATDDLLAQHLDALRKDGFNYLFMEVPSEDIQTLQLLGSAGFSLIETRLHYYNDHVQDYSFPKRYDTRFATTDDIINLRRVASFMRNRYDRFHADAIFATQKADEFLSTYIENAIKGYSDIVMVPDEAGVAPDSFLTGDYYEKDWNHLGQKVSKMVLSAVSAETNKGWYLKLISEMTYHFKHKGIDVAHMNTQSTNRAVFRVWSKLGYQLGRTTHVFSKHLK